MEAKTPKTRKRKDDHLRRIAENIATIGRATDAEPGQPDTRPLVPEGWDTADRAIAEIAAGLPGEPEPEQLRPRRSASPDTRPVKVADPPAAPKIEHDDRRCIEAAVSFVKFGMEDRRCPECRKWRNGAEPPKGHPR